MIYGAIMLVLWARLILLGLGYNVMNYFVFKANLRKARDIYRETGLRLWKRVLLMADRRGVSADFLFVSVLPRGCLQGRGLTSALPATHR